MAGSKQGFDSGTDMPIGGYRGHRPAPSEIRRRDQLDDHYDQNRILNKMSQLVKELERNGERLRGVPGDIVARREGDDPSMEAEAFSREIGQFVHAESDSKSD